MNGEPCVLSITTGRFVMFRRPTKYLALIFAATLIATTAQAEAPSVTAVLTSSQTVLGRPVQLQIKITGSPSARPPDFISVDGLDIRYSGQSQMVEGRNFQFSYSFVYSLHDHAAADGHIQNSAAKNSGGQQFIAHAGVDTERDRLREPPAATKRTRESIHGRKPTCVR